MKKKWPNKCDKIHKDSNSTWLTHYYGSCSEQHFLLNLEVAISGTAQHSNSSSNGSSNSTLTNAWCFTRPTVERISVFVTFRGSTE